MPSSETSIRGIIDEVLEENGLGRMSDDVFTLVEKFDLLPDPTQALGKNVHFDLTGTGTVPAPTFLTGGAGILIATRTASAADDDEAGIWPLSQSAWGNALDPTTFEGSFDFEVRTGASIAETTLMAGIKNSDTIVPETDDDQAFFMFSTDDTSYSEGTYTASANWLLVRSVNGTDVITDTGIPVVAATDYKLTVKLLGNGTATFHINDSGPLGESAVAWDNNLATQKPFFRLASRADAGAPKSHGIRESRKRVIYG